MSVKNISSIEAYKMLMSKDKMYLVDVRTKEEWENIGRPCLKGKNNILFLSWQLSPYMNLNSDFVIDFTSNIKERAAHIFFICKSGYRSFSAATFIISTGYRHCYNIIDGFEGNNSDNGWRKNNLPWQF